MVLAFAGPFLLLSKKARAGLGHKLGFAPRALKAKKSKRLWFHAVSVGEFNALLPVLESYHQLHPDHELFVSTTTATGQQLAKDKAGTYASIFHFPLDLPWATNNFLNAIKPDLVSIVETEIWPGFMNQCRQRNIPVVLINGRLSPRSFKSYMRWRWFFGKVINRFAAVAVQSEQEAARFRLLAGDELKISVCGNIKFDGIKKLSAPDIGLQEAEHVLVAGSTHEGEEQALLAAVKDTGIRLILAPRHPERFERVAHLIEQNGFRPRRFSQNQIVEKENDVYLLDVIGQLNRFYSLGTIAFVGGTLVPVGGHNLTEPYAYELPVICGPHIHKTKDVAQALLDEQALFMVQNKDELKKLVVDLAFNKGRRLAAGQSGWRWLKASQGACNRTLALLEQTLQEDKTSCCL